MGKYVDLIKSMGEMTLSHTENVMRVTEGLCNGGVAVTTDKDGNQGIFTPASRKGSFKSLEMFRKIAEKNGLSVNVIRPDWAKEETKTDDKRDQKPQEDHQKKKTEMKTNKHGSTGIINKKKAESCARDLIKKGLNPNEADEWFIDDDGKYKSMTTGEIPSKFDEDGQPVLVSRGKLRYKYNTENGKITEVDPNKVIDPSDLGDLDIEIDEDQKKAKVKGHGVDREMSVADLSAYHSGILDACAMLGIDLPKFLNGEGELVTKEEAAEFLKTKEGKQVVADVVAKLTGELGGGENKEAPKSEKKEEKKEKTEKKGGGKEKKVPYQFKEPDEKSRDFLDKHVKIQALDEAMAGEGFDDKRRNYVKNVIISEIEWAYKRGDKFFPKEDDFVKFEVENISKNNVVYLKRPDIRMVIVPFRWDRKIYRVFTRSQDEAKDIAEINAWIEGKVREEEVRNQQEAAAKEAEKKATEGTTAA